MRHHEHFDMDEIKRLTNGHWAAIYGALAPQLGHAMKVWDVVPCRPWRQGCFRLRKDSVEGHGLCATCTDGKRIDGFAMLMLVNGWSFPEAVKEALSVVDPGRHRLSSHRPATPVRVAPVTTPVRDEEDVREDERKLARLRDVWSQSLSLQDAQSGVARRYFESRGLRTPAGVDTILRFVPALPYYMLNRRTDRMEHLGDFPALVARVSDIEGRPVTLHRTYLASDGRGKALLPDDESPKKLMEVPSTRNLMGCSIRLAPKAPVIAIAEGIETALAVHEMTGFATWATVSSTFMDAFIPPPEVKAVWVWADKDLKGAGQAAAERLVGALRAHRLRVTSVVPPFEIPEGRSRSTGTTCISSMASLSSYAAAVPIARPFDPDIRHGLFDRAHVGEWKCTEPLPGVSQDEAAPSTCRARHWSQFQRARGNTRGPDSGRVTRPGLHRRCPTSHRTSSQRSSQRVSADRSPVPLRNLRRAVGMDQFQR